jgi:hypothetical protein
VVGVEQVNHGTMRNYTKLHDVLGGLSMSIKNLRWELETTFTRKQVIAMAKVAEFVANIEKYLLEAFPSGCKDVDWQSVREVMSLFAQLGSQDTLAYKALCKSIEDVNAGRVQLLCGKAVPNSPFEVGDKVKCINTEKTMLNYGTVYTVFDYSENGIRVEDSLELGWIHFDRFVKVES